MQRTISILERVKAGGLKATDRMTVKCDDDHSGIEKALAACKKSGATMVLILAEDDSVLRHWTAPVETEKPAAE
ncbi:MAG TPA: hypothetical protein VIH40_13770 [Xanthobacteraceae bacterium]